jgi:hypothetical protein
MHAAMVASHHACWQVWGESVTNVSSYFYGHPAETTAFVVARWFARGGTLNNYYVRWHSCAANLLAG